MAPRQYVEKPLKVQAEQYLAATVPPIEGVCTIAHDPFPDGAPHAHVYSTGARVLHDTDVLVWNYYHPDRLEDVVPLAEFEDRFGVVAPTES
jgi:hypothetical protein